MPLPHLRKAIKGETGELNIPAPSVLISISSGESPSRGEAFFRKSSWLETLCAWCELK